MNDLKKINRAIATIKAEIWVRKKNGGGAWQELRVSEMLNVLAILEDLQEKFNPPKLF